MLRIVPVSVQTICLALGDMQKLSSVLLVDDDATTNFLNEELLTRLGVTERVLVAQNGQQALEVLASECPPAGSACPVLVLLDIHMPVMNGVEFLEAYHPVPPDPAIVVIILTTSLHPRDLARLQQLPHAGFISKPLTGEKVDKILQEHFQRQLPAQ